MAKNIIKSYGEQRAGEHFGLLSNSDIKMKAFFALIMEDVYPQLDTTWEISLIDKTNQEQWEPPSAHGRKPTKSRWTNFGKVKGYDL